MRNWLPVLRNAWFISLNTLFCLAFFFAIIEIGARYYLNYMVDDETFRRYASFRQYQERAAARKEPFSRWAPHRYIGFIPAPNYRKGDDYHNSQGYRGDKVVMPKPLDEFRIACLGGSTTYDSGIDNPKLTYPVRLEAGLRNKGYGVSVINASAMSWTTYEGLIDLELRLLDLEPDLLLLHYGMPDIASRILWPAEVYKGDNSGMRVPIITDRFMPSLLEYSTALRALLVYTGRAQPHMALEHRLQGYTPNYVAGKLFRQAATETYPSEIFGSVPPREILKRNPPIYFERNLRSIVGIAKAHGVKTVFVTFPGPPVWISIPDISDAVKEANEIIKRVAADSECPLFDLDGAYPNSPDLYRDGQHNNEAGAQLKADIMAKFLLTQSVIPDSAKRK